MLNNGKETLLSIPLEKASDFLDIRERKISSTFDKNKVLNKIRAEYRKAK
ncbi:MAG: WbqC family protein [Planctomycetota bacterium]